MAESDRHALLVSSSRYADPSLQPLTAPTEDAEALAAALRDPSVGGFRVREIVDQPSWVVAEEVERFFAERGLNDISLFYFSGHGIKDEDGALYFAAMNTKRQLLRSTAVASDHMIAAMRRCRSRQQVLLLDCCYAGAFSRAMLTKGDEHVGVQERFATEGAGRVVITASDAMQYAFEGEQLHGEAALSIFTRALVEGMTSGDADRNGDGRVTLDELYDYLYERVRRVNPSQTPTTSNLDKRGEIVIALNPHASAPQPQAVPETESTDEVKEAPGRVRSEAAATPVTEVEASFVVSELVAVKELGVSLRGGIAVSPDGRYLATSGDAVHTWELPSGRQLFSLEGVGTAVWVAFSPDGRYLAVGGQLWEFPAGLKAPLMGGVFSPDGRLVAAGGQICEFPERRELVRVEGRQSFFGFSPDGRLFATGAGSTVRVYELPSGRQLCAVKDGGFFSPIVQAAFTIDGRYLATAAGKAVRLWKLPDGLDAGSIGHEGIRRFAFSHDGCIVVTTGYGDAAARVWELSSRQEIGRVNHAGVYDVTFSPDGRLLVTAGNHMVRVWQVSPEASA
jgi:uncharacterized caspase-like protein